MSGERITCACGRSILRENWENHLLRQDGQHYRPGHTLDLDDPASVERLAAALTAAYPNQYESFGPDLAIVTARAIIERLRR